MYSPSFKALQDRISVMSINGSKKISMPYDEFLDIVRLLLRGAAFDEKWYLKQYPDVAEAIKSGVLKSAKQHFVETGYFEGRHPGPLKIDEKFYLREYPDVAEGCTSGEIPSPLQHYIEHGFAEGRLPAEF